MMTSDQSVERCATAGQQGGGGGCPLCGSSVSVLMERVAVADLEREYQRQLGVSVVEEFPPGQPTLELHRCGGCGLEYFDPVVTGSAAFYARLGGEGHYYSTTRWEFTETLRRLTGEPDLIDVGCGDGFFLRLVPGQRRRGIEFNPDAARRARDSGLAVEERAVETLPAGSADVVTLFQVLEHVSRPREVLGAVERVLRPGGRLFVAVPNNDGWVGEAPPNPLNAPPHHVLRWRSEALRSVPKWTGLNLEELLEEPLAPEHLHAYRRAGFLRWCSGFNGGPIPRYGLGTRAVACRRLATALTEVSLWWNRQLPQGPGTGHSVLAIYRKSGGTVQPAN